MVDESAKSLATFHHRRQFTCSRKWPTGHPGWVVASHLGNTADVFVAVFFRETEVLVQPKADIITVESVRGQADVKQMLLQGRGDRGLARGREAREPDCEPALSAQLVALVAGERGVPSDIPALCQSVFFG